jgi:hypothetical protein
VDVDEILANDRGGLYTEVEVSDQLKLEWHRDDVYMSAVTGTFPSSGLRIRVFSQHTHTYSDVLDPATHGERAGYGDLATASTKFDPSVRQARCVTNVKVDLNEGVFAALRQEALTTLFPTCGSEYTIDFDLDKVNIYGPGDHFAKHVDTPRPNTWGTLVITCPREMYGADLEGGLVLYSTDGDLMLREGCEVQTLDQHEHEPEPEPEPEPGPGPKPEGENDYEPGAPGAPEPRPSKRRKPSSAMATHATYSMFFSDVVHEVQPVSRGWRVSITYRLVLRTVTSYKMHHPAPEVGPGGPGAGARIGTEPGVLARSDFLEGSMSRALVHRVATFVTRKVADKEGHIAVLCSNKYSYDEIDAGVLKGFDADLDAHLRSSNLFEPVRMEAVAVRATASDSKLDSAHSETSVDVALYRMSRRDLLRSLNDACDLLSDPDVELVCRKKYLLVMPQWSFLDRVINIFDAGAVYTGNESRDCSVDCRYWATCLFYKPKTYAWQAPDQTYMAPFSVGGEPDWT